MADIVVKTQLVDGTPVEWDKKWITNIESLSQSNSNPSSVYYGAIDSSGSITIKDIDNSIYKNITDQKLSNNNLHIDILVNNKKICEHIASKVDYDYNTKELNIQLNGVLERLSKEKYGGISVTENRDLLTLTTQILTDFGYTSEEIDTIFSNQVVYGDNNTSGTISGYLSSITIPFSFISNGITKLDALNEICRIAQLQLYEGDNGLPMFVSARPVIAPKELKNIIVLKANNQYSNFDSSIILNNKYKSVGYTKSNAYMSFGEIENIDSNIFDQTKKTGLLTTESGDSATFYSGSLADYSENIKYTSTASNNFKVYGVYKYATLPDTSDRGIVCRYSFKIDNILTDTTTYYDSGVTSGYIKALFLAGFSNYNRNEKDMLDGSTKPTKFLLSNVTKSLSVVTNDNDPFVLILGRPQFVKSEQEALSNLCNMDGNNILSIKSDVVTETSPYQIVVDGDTYTCYFQMQITEDGKSPSELSLNYTGDLLNIILSGGISMMLRSLHIDNTETNRDADIILQSSNLLQAGSTLNGKDLIESISNNITSDYANGVSDGSITVSCSNYYNTHGEKVKDFNSGDIIQVGDVVRIDKNDLGDSARTYTDGTPMYWRVTSRKFRKSGCPFVDLEVMEVKNIFEYALSISSNNVNLVVTRTESPLADAPLVELKNGDLVYKNDVLHVSATVPFGHEVSLIINGQLVPNNSDYTVTADTNIVATTETVTTYTLSTGISTVTRTASSAGGKLGAITSADPLYEGDIINIEYSGDIREYSITMGGTIIASGSDIDSANINETISVSGNVVISIVKKSWGYVDYGNSSNYAVLSFDRQTTSSSHSWNKDYDFLTNYALVSSNVNKKTWHIRPKYYRAVDGTSITGDWIVIGGVSEIDDNILSGNGCGLSITREEFPQFHINTGGFANNLVFDVKQSQRISVNNNGQISLSQNGYNNYIQSVDVWVSQYEYH